MKTMGSMFRGQALGYMAAVFLAGVVAGAGVGYSAGKRAMVKPPPAPGLMSTHVTERLTRELGLDGRQVGSVKPIVDEACAEMESAHGENVRRMCEIMKRTNRKIEPLLTEEQKAKLKEEEAKREASMRKFARGGASGTK